MSALQGEGGVAEESDEDGEGPGGYDQPDGDLVDLAGHHQDHLPLLQDSPEPQAEQDTPAELQYEAGVILPVRTIVVELTRNIKL